MHARSLLLGLLSLAACKGGTSGDGHISPPVAFGEPVGITLADAAGLPPKIEIRVAVTAGRATDPLVKPIAGAVLGGLRACPAFVKSVQEGTIPSLAFRVEQGKVASGTSDDTSAKCVLGDMVGKSIGDAAMPPLDALAIVRFGAPDGAE